MRLITTHAITTVDTPPIHIGEIRISSAMRAALGISAIIIITTVGTLSYTVGLQ